MTILVQTPNNIWGGGEPLKLKKIKKGMFSDNGI